MAIHPHLITALRVKRNVLAGLIIGVAVIVIVLRLSVWLLPVYQDALESAISTDEYQIDLAPLAVSWEYGLPQLRADGLTVRVAGQEVIHAEHLRARIDWWRSLKERLPVLKTFDAEGLTLSVYADADGQISLLSKQTATADNDESSGSAALYAWLKYLALQGQVRLLNAQLQVVEPGGNHEFSFEGILQGQNDTLEAGLTVTHADSAAVDLKTRVVLNNQTTSGELYLRWPEQTLGFWQNRLTERWPQLLALNASGEAWLDWQQDRLSSLTSNLDVSELSLDVQGSPLLLSNLSLFAQGMKDAQGWRFSLRPSQGRINNAPIPFDQLFGQLHQDQLLVNINTLDLGILDRLLATVEQIPSEVRTELAEVAPSGLLKAVRFSTDLQSFQQETPSLLLNAELVGVSVAAYQGAPRVDHLQGTLSLDESQGRVRFDSEPLFLGFPDLYTQGWGLSRAEGAVYWRLTPDKLWLHSEKLRATMDGIVANGRFSLDMPFAKDMESEFSLLIGTEGANGALTSALVPDKEIDQNLFDWLAAAVVKGRVNRGAVLYHGSLESWAPDPSIQLYFDVSDGEIKYAEDWPSLTSVGAQVLVKDSEVLVTASEGKIYDTPLSVADIYLAEGSDHLSVQAKLEGSGSDALKVLMNSPVKAQLGNEFPRWNLEGGVKTTLNLKLNLADLAKSAYQVESTLSNGRYYSDERHLSIEKINGTLNYDETHGLNGKGLKAQFLGKPVYARVDTQSRNQQTHSVIRIDGNVDVGEFNQWLDLELLNLLSGEVAVSAFIDLCSSAKGSCSSIQVKSDLVGIETVLLPAPYGKTAEQKRPLDVRTELGGEENWMRLRLADQLEGLLLIGDQGLLGGELVLGGNQPLPESRKQGLWIRGVMDRFVVSDWQALAEHYQDDAITDEGTVKVAPLLQNIDLFVPQMELSEEMQFQQLMLGFRTVPEGRELTINSAEVKGTILLPTVTEVAYQIHFDRLYLPRSEEEVTDAETVDVPEETESVDPLLDVDPAKLPPVTLNIDDFRHGDRQLGHWQMRVTPIEDGLDFSGFQIDNAAVNVKGNLHWLLQNDGHISRLNLTINSPQLAKLQSLFEIDPVMDAKNVNLNANVFWRGSPLGYHSKTLTGEIDLTGGAGRFIDAGAASALRLFGILNLNTLSRRLRLDFDDLSKGGLAFDTIKGRYGITDGVARSTEVLKVFGPSVDLEMDGEFDLVTKTLDQRLRVTLPISDSLPLTALLLASPQIAGAMFLFDKLAGKQLSQITSSRYRVTGPWSDPKVDVLKTEKADKTKNGKK